MSSGSREPLAASSGSRQPLAASSGTTYSPINLLPRLEEEAVIRLTLYKGIVLKDLFSCQLRTFHLHASIVQFRFKENIIFVNLMFIGPCIIAIVHE